MSPTRPPSFIYFDLGNVILNFSHHRAARQIAAVAGISEQAAWDAVFDSGLESEYEHGNLTTRQFYEAFRERTHTWPDYDQLVHAASDIFELNVPIVPVITRLRAAGHRLGILSNTNAAHWHFVSEGRYSVVRDLFDVYALSFEMRAMKPEPQAYERAAEIAGTRPDEIFYTDDHAENVAAATRAGFDAVLFTSALELAEQLRSRGVQFAY